MILRLAVGLFHSPSPVESKLLRSLLLSLLDRDGDPQPPILRLDPEEEEVDEHGVCRRWLDRQGELGADIREVLELGGIREATLPTAPPAPKAADWSHGAGAWRRAPLIDVTVEPRSVSDWPNLRLTLVDALELVREPLHFRLEDANNDFEFVGWLAPPSSRRDLERLRHAPARVHVHGGGTSKIQGWLDDLIKSPVLLPEQQRRLWRTWVLFDRDAGDLDARTPSKTVQTLVDSCEQVIRKHRIPFTWVCLQRREIESYVPDDGLRRTGAPGSVQAAKLLREWRARPDRQEYAWAYDMKIGLRGDLLRGISDSRREAIKRHQAIPSGNELKAPFDCLDKETRRALRAGFGDSVLNEPLHDTPARTWLHQIANEYDRGPAHQIPRASLVQSIFDRI